MVTRWSRPRTAPGLPLFLWHTLVSGPFTPTFAGTNTDPLSFAEKVIKAVKGEKGIVEPSFVYLPGVAGGDAIAKTTGCDFFSVPIELGVCVVFRIYSVPC